MARGFTVGGRTYSYVSACSSELSLDGRPLGVRVFKRCRKHGDFGAGFEWVAGFVPTGTETVHATERQAVEAAVAMADGRG